MRGNAQGDAQLPAQHYCSRHHQHLGMAVRYGDVLASLDQKYVEHDANQNHDEPAKGKKRANFQQAVEGLASLRQSKFDPERQKQT
jgi:hypothetical protein